MDESIIIALITGVVSLLVCMMNNKYQQKSNDRKYNETIALIDYKLSELTKHVEKHNCVVERTYKLEQEMALMNEKIKNIQRSDT